MISIIVVGRNDGFGLNLAKRTAISLNHFASLCEDDDDEIIYVDCNTNEAEVTLTESIADTLTPKARSVIKTFRVSGEQMQLAVGETPMPISDELSRNIGIRRSNPNNQWILNTNCDILLSPVGGSFHEVLKSLTPCFYLCPRRGIPYEEWRTVNRMDSEAISDFCDQMALSAKRFPAEMSEPWRRFGSIGDFQLAPRSQWFDIGGCEEGMNLWGHSDVNNAKRLSILNNYEKTPDLAKHILLYHLDHNVKKSVSANSDVIPHNDPKRWVENITEYHSSNATSWGLDGVNLPSLPLCESCQFRNESNSDVTKKNKPRSKYTRLKIKAVNSFSRIISRIMDRLKI